MDINVSSCFLDKVPSFLRSINRELYTLHVTNLMLITPFKSRTRPIVHKVITREVQRYFEIILSA